MYEVKNKRCRKLYKELEKIKDASVEYQDA